MLMSLHIYRSEWPTLFMPWGGTFPTTSQQLTQLKTGIRQRAHMLENGPTSIHNLGRHQGATHFTDTENWHTNEEQPTTMAWLEWAVDRINNGYDATDATATGHQRCEQCGSPAADLEDFNSDTDEDDGHEDYEYEQIVALGDREACETPT